jgi:ribose transport system permease protein
MGRRTSTTSRLVRRHAWTAGVWLLLVLLVVWYSTLLPRFGGFESSSIVRSGLPLALLALAQASVVIGGGIDLGLGALLILTNAISARFMEAEGLGVSIGIALAVVVVGTVLNALVGWIIARSGVPDIVVTLATLFVFGGMALWVLPSPGGGMSEGLRWLFTGSEVGIGTNPWPSLAVIVVVGTAVWYGLRRTRTGLSIYASGSSRQAAFLSGIDVARTKVNSYAIAGGLAALAGLATTAITGGGDARFAIASGATLDSVAAIVLGGIALTGGIGSVLGALAAGYALMMLSPIMTALRVDPNQAQVVQGTLIVLVVMVGGLWRARREAKR